MPTTTLLLVLLLFLYSDAVLGWLDKLPVTWAIGHVKQLPVAHSDVCIAVGRGTGTPLNAITVRRLAPRVLAPGPVWWPLIVNYYEMANPSGYAMQY